MVGDFRIFIKMQLVIGIIYQAFGEHHSVHCRIVFEITFLYSYLSFRTYTISVQFVGYYGFENCISHSCQPLV